MKAKSLDMSWIVVTDLHQAVKFYTEVVGLKLIEQHDQFGWAELQGYSGGARFGIAQVQPEKDDWMPGDNACATFTVDDLDQAKKEAQKKGAQMVGDIIEIPGHVKMQMVADADGNRFQLVQKLFL